MTSGQNSSLAAVVGAEVESSTGLFVGLSDAKPVGAGVFGLSAEETRKANVGSRDLLGDITGRVVGANVILSMASLVAFPVTVVFNGDMLVLLVWFAIRLLCTVVTPTDVVVATEASATAAMITWVVTAIPAAAAAPAAAPAATPAEHEAPTLPEACTAIDCKAELKLLISKTNKRRKVLAKLTVWYG